MRNFFARIRSFCAVLTVVLFPTLVYLITLYCAITSSHQHSPLGLVSSEHGILILNVLSKVGDIVLVAAAETLWEFITLVLVAGKTSTSLSTIFALSSNIGFFGLFDIAKRRNVKLSRSYNERWWALFR